MPLWKWIAMPVVFAASVYIANQVRKPSRGLGRGALARMNLSHSRLTDWGLEHVRVEKRFTILDVGCGGGRTIQKLAAVATEFGFADQSHFTKEFRRVMGETPRAYRERCQG